MSTASLHRMLVPPAVLAATTLLVFGACGGGGGGAGVVAPPVTPPAPPPPTATCTFTNPIMRGADPSVVRQGNVYYSVQSRDGGIVVFRSDALTQLDRNGVRVWTRPDTGWNSRNVWAPELEAIDGKWYIYYAAGRSGPPFTTQRTGVLESATSDPQGAWIDRGQLWTGDGPAGDPPDNVWAIDMTVGRIGGVLYAVWSGWERNAFTDRTPQNLYIARMASPTRIAGPRVRLSAPTAPWEQRTVPDGLELQEGPELVERGGRTYVFYSTRESWLPGYQLGLLTLNAGADPLVAASWVKTGPVFSGSGNVFGVGHASFTTSPDGTEDWIVYHAKTTASPGWDDRVIRTQRFTWNADGTPSFGTPVQTGVPTARPSGECR